MTDEDYMRRAIALCKEKMDAGVGGYCATIIVRDGEVIGEGWNNVIEDHDATGHCEINAIRDAGRRTGNWNLSGSTLYTTWEPCSMCAGAILQARLPLVVYGADDPKAGAVRSLFEMLNDSRLNHRCHTIPGVLADECGGILTCFFEQQRALGKK